MNLVDRSLSQNPEGHEKKDLLGDGRRFRLYTGAW